MKNYTEYTDLGAADADNPSGKIINGTSGTLLDDVSWNDRHQFFWKCVRDASITPNGTDDNVSNGYQLFDAVRLSLPFGGDTLAVIAAATINIPDDVSIVTVSLPDNDTPAFNHPTPIKGRKLAIYCTTPQTDSRDFAFVGANFTDSFYEPTDTEWTGGTLYSILMEADGNKWHILSYTKTIVACPFVYINGTYVEEIIKNQVGESANAIDVVDITNNVVIGSNEFKLTEEKRETSYIDYVSLKVDGKEVKVFETDIVMNEGDVKTYAFDIEEGFSKVEIEAKGYYIRK